MIYVGKNVSLHEVCMLFIVEIICNLKFKWAFQIIYLFSDNLSMYILPIRALTAV